MFPGEFGKVECNTLEFMSLALELERGILHAEEDAANEAGRRSLSPAIRYSLLVVLLPLLAVPFFIVLGSSDYFLRHGASVWVQSNDAIFAMHDRQCDVLVFGDSTAMTGIDPAVVDRYTGMRTCNIAVTNAVLAVTGNLTLDSYLGQNASPKVLIVQLSPDDFQKENRVWSHTIYAEGLLELLRHGSAEESRHVLFTHPHEAIAFAGYAAGYSAYYAIKDIWFRATHLRSEEDEVEVRNGFFTPPAPARTNCEQSEAMPANATGAFAQSVTHDYQTAYGEKGAVVLVDVAPIPACDENLEAYSRELQGVTNNSLQGLPIGLFNDSRHYTAFGSRVVSALVARQVNQMALRDPALNHRDSSVQTLAGLRTVAAGR